MKRIEILKQLKKYIRPYRVYIVLSLFLALFTVFVSLYIPILTGDMIDYIVSAGNVDFDSILQIIKWILILVAISLVSQLFMNISNNKISYGVVKDLRKDAFLRIIKTDISYIDKKNTGEIVNQVIADIDQISDGLLIGFSTLFTGGITILGTIILMLRINLVITAIVVLLTPVSFFVARFIAKHSYDMFSEQAMLRGEQTSLIEQIINNPVDVKVLCYEKDAINSFEKGNERLADISKKGIFYSSITNPATRFVNSIVYAAVGVFGAFYALYGGITIGGLSCFLTYATQYTKPFNEISGVIAELQNTFACAAHVFELINIKINDTENLEKLDSDNTGKVEFENVNFSYEKDKKIIKDFSIEVKPGQKIAIVGPTGCGKTTLVNLLMGFYDADTGRIVVSNKDISKVSKKSLRKCFGMVLQDTWLFAGTIAENIALGKKDATREEIIEVAKKCHAHSFIKCLPKGYDTVIAENGGDLSQGQRQLLSIARVMLLNPPMLILDEATSNIDTRTEMIISKACEKMMENKSSFIVAHRLATILSADVILVMKDGKIVEKGTHTELMNMDGFYKKMYMAQWG